MKKIIAISVLLFSSTQLMADNMSSALAKHGSSVLTTEVTDTKDQALRNGYKLISELKNSDGSRKGSLLGLPFLSVNFKTIDIDEGYVTVQERSYEDGETRYVGNVHVDYHYSRSASGKNR